MRCRTSQQKISLAAVRKDSFPAPANSTFAPALRGRGLAKIKIGDTARGEADIAAAKAIDPRVGELFVKNRFN
jgi:hypothetical protein